jgi:hypothetical protein
LTASAKAASEKTLKDGRKAIAKDVVEIGAVGEILPGESSRAKLILNPGVA